ncbi:unnamed protein product [Phyllotreta striolata]|uniref:UDP-glucuronosyltransferase n=1 Tax=Phyllotreta striolata TaxID=444603 RepID=A0A9N9TRN3_PHYSR|nr:unnamed protein product [Phyllotreta striolata]
MNLYVLFVSALFAFNSIDCLNILAVMPHMGKSHQLVFEPLFKKLVENGHSLTLITRYPQKKPVPNWTDINISNVEYNSTEIVTFDSLTGTRLDRYLCSKLLASFAYITCEEGLSHPNYLNFLKTDQHFDLVLIETFNTNCFMGVAKKFKVPIIGIHSGEWMPWLHGMFSRTNNPSYVSDHFLGHSDSMSFLERVENTIFFFINQFVYDMFLARQGKQLSKDITGVDLEEDMMKNISLLLINTHFTLNSKLPLSPNSIEIGGIHVINQPINPLPKDLKKFIEEAKHGVIYMSLGSTIRGDSLPEEKKRAFLNAFSRLKQRVVWKWEGEMTGKTPNVLIYRWTPQRDVLCHPNVKAYIGHSGILGVMEAVDCSKPILLLPLFGDQFTNAINIQRNGGGIMLHWNSTNEDAIYDTLQKLLSPKFEKSAKDLSSRFKDRPLAPMETALYWIHYVSRHKGAPFMKTAAVDMPFYQHYLLDVIGFLLVIFLTSFYVIYKSTKCTLKLLCKRPHQKIKKS